MAAYWRYNAEQNVIKAKPADFKTIKLSFDNTLNITITTSEVNRSQSPIQLC